ncbi:homoserine dehydrogenase [Natranaerovirga hydrolytica]|uniref:Homoserine dehydrogenase n=1 Tax=Natranaerovirga hydrolytica TaxID=680378 RepID=A0A4R1M6Q4_9FIRM|nr:homoserine dehydrogenase [Natranaerovirga hydrolytica]TCK87946.1 homoserine dehydrogenase [Natranaerovirga hydrolytica]
MVNIAILGYGTVGSGVVEVLNTNKRSIEKKAGKEINVKYVLDKKDFPDDPIQNLIVHDYETIINDDSVDVIVEVMGGIEPAYTFVKKALLKGKSVTTSNKELVAKHGAELLQIAKDNNISFLFEASVGGGIPIIRPLNESLTADEIYEITGILNGTTNFVLSKMSSEGSDFDDVLKEAQDKGYAERNPEADIEGHDACRKIAILSSLAFGMQVDYEDIYTEGITKIKDKDMAYAKYLGYDIKLLASSKKIDNNIYARVAPMMLGSEHPLANVHGVFNAILIKGNVIGDVMFYGKGAGKLPTASAVVADVVDLVKHMGKNLMYFWSTEKMRLMEIEKVPAQYFIRIKGSSSNLDANVQKLFGAIQVIQLETLNDEFAIITEEETEGNLNKKVEQLKKLTDDETILSIIRLEN